MSDEKEKRKQAQRLRERASLLSHYVDFLARYQAALKVYVDLYIHAAHVLEGEVEAEEER